MPNYRAADRKATYNQSVRRRTAIAAAESMVKNLLYGQGLDPDLHASIKAGYFDGCALVEWSSEYPVPNRVKKLILSHLRNFFGESIEVETVRKSKNSGAGGIVINVGYHY